MATQRKIFTVQNLTQKLKEAKALVLADYRGLDVGQMAKLRAAIKKAGGELEVVKNTLLKLAAKDSKLETGDLPRRQAGWKLDGPTVALWIYEDSLAPLKALDNFIKKTNLPKIKLGFWNGQLISIERIKELAGLPSLEELKVRLVGTLQSPALGLVNALGWNMRSLICVLKRREVSNDGKKAIAKTS